MLRRRINDWLTIIGIVSSLFTLLYYPKDAVSAASNGVSLCINVIIPSLFPYFVLSSLIVELGLAERLGYYLAPVTQKLFHVSGACSAALVLGFISGYPVGARTVLSLYSRGDCTKDEAERLLAYCNNSGPAFIFGVVGAAVFTDNTIGIMLYVVHFLTSILIGLVLGFSSKTKTSAKPIKSNIKYISFTDSFVSSVKGGFFSCLSICGFVIFFTVFIKLLTLSGIIPFIARQLFFIGVDGATAEKLITGVIEMTSGVWSLSGEASSLCKSAAMAAFMLGWAGISVHCQVLSFLSGSGLSAKKYIIGRFAHGILSALIVYLIFIVFPFNEAVSAYLAAQVTTLSTLRLDRALLTSLTCCGAVLLMFAPFIIKLKKNGKSSNKKKNNV
jgi:sporulation integral membrane protein YlbJ